MSELTLRMTCPCGAVYEAYAAGNTRHSREAWQAEHRACLLPRETKPLLTGEADG